MSGEAEGKVLVFVYGTLRRRASEGARMAEAEQIGRRTIQGALREIDSKPALVRSDDVKSRVLGDLYRVRVDQLEEIDRWHEREDGGTGGGCYTRAQEPIPSPEGKVPASLAWVWRWIGPTDAAAEIPSGDWLDVEQPRTLPLFTCIAAAALASPPILMAVVEDEYKKAGYPDFIPSPLGYIIVLGAASPFVGCAAYYFAERRRERWLQLRFVVLALLVLECIPGALILVMALGEVRNWF